MLSGTAAAAPPQMPSSAATLVQPTSQTTPAVISAAPQPAVGIVQNQQPHLSAGLLPQPGASVETDAPAALPVSLAMPGVAAPSAQSLITAPAVPASTATTPAAAHQLVHALPAAQQVSQAVINQAIAAQQQQQLQLANRAQQQQSNVVAPAVSMAPAVSAAASIFRAAQPSAAAAVNPILMQLGASSNPGGLVFLPRMP